MRTRKSILIAILTLFAQSLSGQQVNHYDLVVNFDMKQKSITVSGDLKVDFNGQDSLKLTLNRNTEIKAMKSMEGDIEHIFDTTSPPPMYVPLGCDLILVKEPGDSDLQTIQLHYESDYRDLAGWANSFLDNWVELNLYCAWFPTNYQSGSFTATLEIHIDDGYEISGSGLISGNGNSWIMEQPWPAFDIILLASEDLKNVKVENENNTFITVYNDFPETAADSVLADCEYALKLYQELFGQTDRTYLKFVLSPFEKGGGYSRKNFIVMRTMKYDIHTQGGIAHEMAHFWWNNADVTTWEDWLNESFAEYSKLIYFRERLGQEVFDEKLKKYAKVTKDTPPIYNIDRNSEHAYAVLYYKGALILYQMEEKMGADNFRQFLKMVSSNKIGRTDDLLALIEKKYSHDLSQWLDNMLKTE